MGSIRLIQPAARTAPSRMSETPEPSSGVSHAKR